MLFYRAALPLSSRTLNYAAGIIRRHRKAIGSWWRKLNPARQALLVLAYLRKGETFAELAAGFEVGTTTAWRYVNETTELLAARAPKLRQAVRDAKKAGWAYVVLDGTLIPVGCSFAHAVRVWRGVRRQRGANVLHEGQGRPWRGPQSEDPGLLVRWVAEAVPVRAGCHEHRARHRLLRLTVADD